jgi:hypothetical protein
MEQALKNFKKQYLLIISLLVFIFLSIWWIYINFYFTDVTLEDKQLFAASYQVLALFGSLIGFSIARRWGGWKSMLGKALVFFSLGLLLQSFGQSVYSYFIFFQKIEIPYPSLGDFGYFGSVIAYILGTIQLVRVSGFHLSWRSMQNKIISIIIPLILLGMSYFFFLKGYEFDWNEKIKTLLDFGYPLGQAFYVSIAILTLLLSRNILGGIMKKPIIFLVVALIVQYLSDFMFLYQAHQETWSAGEFNDYLYCISYFMMTVALIHIGGIFNKIKENN